MKIGTEIVQFKVRDDISEDDFISIVDGLEENYHSKQPGFMDTELLFDEKAGIWTILQHWESLEQMKAASKSMFIDPAAKSFVEAVIPATVRMSVFPQLKKWAAAL